MGGVASSPPCAVDPSLDQYLHAVARGLWAIGPARRREILRTLRSDLLDLAEDRGLQEDRAFAAFLRGQPAPSELARSLQWGELDDAYGRILLALLPMVFAGLWTVLTLPPGTPWATPAGIKQVLWYGSLTYLYFALRGSWAARSEPQRLLRGLLLGGLGGFVWFALALNSWPDFLALRPFLQAVHNHAAPSILKGAFIGFTIERVASRRRWWVLALDAPVYFLLLQGHVALHRPLLPPAPRPSAGQRLLQPGRDPSRPSIAMLRTPLPRVQLAAVQPVVHRVIPLTVGLQAALWAGARTSRRLGLLRLFRRRRPEED